MQTLSQFLNENGVTKVQMLIGEKGKEFCTVKDKLLTMNPEKVDKKKPLFVTKVEKNEAGEPLHNVYAICNSKCELASTFEA